MWKWDQGRMQYFQFDTLRVMAELINAYDFKNIEPNFIRRQTHLNFAPATYTPWRNYSRIFKLCMLVVEKDSIAYPTAIANILSKPGIVTCDEYMHFIVEATTDPSPALTDWRQVEDGMSILRNPLCFSLKYVLAKVAIGMDSETSLLEIIGAYIFSGFTGAENDCDFIELLKHNHKFLSCTKGYDVRQAKESIKFISQISYLHIAANSNNIVASLCREDALNVFKSLHPISGPFCKDGNDEIVRLANVFKDGSTHDFFDYENSVTSNNFDSGFEEGNKIKKTHIVIERNSKIRNLFFKNRPTAICDTCNINTNLKYPWTERVLDLHHILPLSSGTRVDSRSGTILDDLIPVCPTCHRAIHRYYEIYLRQNLRTDFQSRDEAYQAYSFAKQEISQGYY